MFKNEDPAPSGAEQPYPSKGNSISLEWLMDDKEQIEAVVDGIARALRDQRACPPDPVDFIALLERLTAAKDSLSPIYRREVLEPLLGFIQELGSDGLNTILQQDPDWTGIARCLFDIVQAVLQNAERHEIDATNAFQEVVADLYNGFLGGEDRRGVSPPEKAMAAPLVKWGEREPAFGPYTWPRDATALFGVQCSIVSLPPVFAHVGIVAWVSLAQETCGHDILNADTGLLGQVAAAIGAELDKLQDGRVTDAWLNWIEEAASDVMGVLNMGPAAGFSLYAYLRGVRKALGRSQLATVGSSKDVHLVDVLRLYLAAATLRECLYNKAEADADALDKLADAQIQGRTIIVDGRPWPLDTAKTSAQLVAGAIARTRFAALEHHALGSIQNWRQRDQELTEALVTLMTTSQADEWHGSKLLQEAYATHVLAAAVGIRLAASPKLPKDFDEPTLFASMVDILVAMHTASLKVDLFAAAALDKAPRMEGIDVNWRGSAPISPRIGPRGGSWWIGRRGGSRPHGPRGGVWPIEER